MKPIISYCILSLLILIANSANLKAQESKDKDINSTVTNVLQFLHSDSSKETFIVFITDSVEIQTNTVILDIWGNFQIFPPPPPNGKFNCDICLINPDSIVIQNSLINGLDSVYQILLSHFDFMETNERISGDSVYISELGVVRTLYPPIVYAIMINSFAQQNPTIDLMRALMSIVDNVFKLYSEKRDEFANMFFDKKFKELSSQQKAAILEYRPMELYIFFNRNCGIYNPPEFNQDLEKLFFEFEIEDNN